MKLKIGRWRIVNPSKKEWCEMILLILIGLLLGLVLGFLLK